MSIEVACPACGGSIQIEDVSEVVACPLCEVHLEINPETNEAVLVTEDSDAAETESQEAAEETITEEPAETPEVNTTTEEAESAVDETPDNDDSDEEPNEAETDSPFAFLPGGNQTKSTKAKPVRPATNFSFLPGANDDSEEPEEEAGPEALEATSEAAAPEIEPETTADEIPAEVETESPKAKPVRPATNFSFLPGANDDSEEPEEEAGTGALEATSEAAAPEIEPETTADEIPAEVEAESAQETTSEETAADETTSEEMSTEESIIEEPGEPETEEKVSEEVPAEESTTEEVATEEGTEETTEETTEEETAADESATGEAAVAETKTEEEATAEASSEPKSPAVPQNYRKAKVVPKRLFTLTLTYAIAATILVAMLLYAKYLGDPHQLESLPDLKPPIKNDEIALQLVPENAKLPAGHTLKLGGPGRRFGNVLVTPLSVTRGPIEFEHYTGDNTKTREPSLDVLKLNLKFENVSSDQTFEPLDQKLLLTRVSGKTSESSMRANNFVCRIDQKQTGADRVLVYDMPPSWEWNLKGQNINQEAQTQNLEPGESFETYVATNEAGIDSLKGELVWRLQLRKGYNPVSYRGVTTLIEVVFNSDQIKVQSPSQKKEPLPTS